jgi:hypothetical protein
VRHTCVTRALLTLCSCFTHAVLVLYLSFTCALLEFCSCFTRALIELYSCFTRALLEFYSCFTRASLCLCACFTHVLLMLYSCFTCACVACALLMLYPCFTHALLVLYFRVTRSINLGFAYLFAMIILPAALLLSVDHRKGMLDVRNAAPAAGTASLHYCITTTVCVLMPLYMCLDAHIYSISRFTSTKVLIMKHY